MLILIFLAPLVSGQQLNGQQLNGQQLNGQQLNGQQLNGQQLNGQQLNGQQLSAGITDLAFKLSSKIGKSISYHVHGIKPCRLCRTRKIS